MNERIRAVLTREWLDLRRNRTVASMVIGLPLLLSVLPIVSLVTMSKAMHSSSSRPPSMKGIPEYIAAMTSDPSVATLMMVVMTALMLFSIVPAVLPSIMAAHSIVGERTERSLEPLLATPIRTWELLAGKLIAIVVPAVVPALVGFVIYAGAVYAIAPAPVFALVVSPGFLLTMGLVGPLLAVLSVTFGIMVSSRAGDLQSAQAIAGLVALPVIGVGMGQLFGAVSLSVTAVLLRALTLAVLDVGAVLLCVSLFERETILSRWK